MRKRVLIICVALFFAHYAAVSAAQRTVAVMNFTNHTGDRGLGELSRSIPEALSATMMQSGDVNVVERAQLGRLLDEIALEQTGIFDERKVSRAGKLSSADVLILGSYSGSASDIVLTIKAVDVATGTILDGRVFRAPLDRLMEMSAQAGLAMASIISGKNLGTVTITSTPSEVDVYIDGRLAGKSPIVEYKIAEGKHRMRVTKTGYLEAETTLNVKRGRDASWSPYLPNEKLRSYSCIALGVAYFMPTSTDVKNAPLYTFMYGHSYSGLTLAAEAGYGKIDHSQELHFPGWNVTQNRYYSTYTLFGHISYVLFPNWLVLQPYAGIMAGGIFITDYRKKATAEDNEEKMLYQKRFSMGIKAGACIIPYSKVSLFVEGRFYVTPKKLQREVFEGGILGESSHMTEYYFNAFSIGGGVRYRFD